MAAYLDESMGDDRRLENGDPPDWLQPVDLPGDLGEAFGLYRVANPAQWRGAGRSD